MDRWRHSWCVIDIGMKGWCRKNGLMTNVGQAALLGVVVFRPFERGVACVAFNQSMIRIMDAVLLMLLAFCVVLACTCWRAWVDFRFVVRGVIALWGMGACQRAGPPKARRGS